MSIYKNIYFPLKHINTTTKVHRVNNNLDTHFTHKGSQMILNIWLHNVQLRPITVNGMPFCDKQVSSIPQTPLQ